MTTVPPNIRYHRALIEALVKERDEAAQRADACERKWKERDALDQAEIGAPTDYREYRRWREEQQWEDPSQQADVENFAREEMYRFWRNLDNGNAERAAFSEAHPFRNLWAWLKRKFV